MEETRDVLPINSVAGMAVLSLVTGNKLGKAEDVFIDPVNGVVLGLTVAAGDGAKVGIPYEEIHNFGRDAIMVRSDASLRSLDEIAFGHQPHASDLISTSVITDSGDLVGQISNVFVTLKPPPLVVYSIRDSMLDKLLGRELFILAGSGHALSDDRERLVVPDETAQTGEHSIEALLNKAFSVRTFDPGQSLPSHSGEDDTWVTVRDEDDLDTVVKTDEDDTVIRLHSDLNPGRQPG